MHGMRRKFSRAQHSEQRDREDWIRETDTGVNASKLILTRNISSSSALSSPALSVITSHGLKIEVDIITAHNDFLNDNKYFHPILQSMILSSPSIPPPTHHYYYSLFNYLPLNQDSFPSISPFHL